MRGISKSNSELYASTGSTENTATPPRFSSLFNRTTDDISSSNIDIDNKKNSVNKNVDVNKAYSMQQRNFALNSVNSNNNDNDSDIDIDNFSSLSDDYDNSDSNNEALLLATTAAVAAAGISLTAFYSSSQQDGASTSASLVSLADPSTLLATGISLVESAKQIFADPGAALDRVVELTDSMGPLGIAYFGVAYCIAEILAIPAIPLTASAGYLFGPFKGTAIVLLSASVAAGVSFAIGRTFLRDYIEGLLKEYPKFNKLDRAIGREGFKLMLLLRLSPVFPFALSNYLYGATSINFSAFFFGTLLGFAPGTAAYVYTGYIGKALTGDAGNSDVYPWYVYLGGLSLFAGLLKVVADTATRVVQEIEAEEEAAAAAQNNTTNNT